MSKPKLDLYFYYQCPFCVRVLNAIENLGIEVNLKNVLENKDYFNEHVEKTGRRTVPCLYIDGTPMFESSDIISWLESNKDKLS